MKIKEKIKGLGNTKIKILIVVAVILISAVSVLIGNHLYSEMTLDAKYDEAYKNRTFHVKKSVGFFEQAHKESIDSDIFSNREKGYQDVFNEMDNAIEHTEKAIFYAKEMKKYANDPVEIEYADIQIILYEKQLIWYKEQKNFYMALYSNSGNYLELNDYVNSKKKDYNELSDKRDYFLKKHPSFENRINKLYNETIV